MSISYPPDIEAAINRLVASGRYRAPIDAIREAVRLLDDRAIINAKSLLPNCKPASTRPIVARLTNGLLN